ncbi:MAG: Kelch repeat-containing protein [Planctomycetota bacterium]|jgi:N-acetylneuraminic acid mutarotase
MFRNKKTTLLVLALALGLASTSLGARGIWKYKADLPTARTYLSTSVVNGKIYAIGGGPRAVSAVSTVEEYDPATDTWTTKSPMPTPRWSLSTSVVNGKIYAIGGAQNGPSGLRTVEEYDPTTDSWTRKANMLTPRFTFSTSAVNGKIYAMGGGVPTGSPLVEEYDPATDTWTRKASMPTGRYAFFTSAVNGRIYAIGGVDSYPTISARVDEYDPVTDTWTRKADMLTPRAYAATSVVNGKIYAMSGAAPNPDNPPIPVVEVYDPETDTWTTKADMPIPKTVFSTSVVDGKIYAIGGSGTGFPWGPALGTVEEYDPHPVIVDLNGDGIVDSADMCIIVDHWGSDEPLCDIGPMPWGDGIVDVQDLTVLAEHLFKDVDDPTLMAHWELDEIEGITAHDSVNGNDDYILGGALWQPAGGMIDGALELDGVDDCIITSAGINPADGPFSIVTWIKGGTPDQVIIAQQAVADWLVLDAEGKLMTELKGFGRDNSPLSSDGVITDGQWHRIGLVWDGSQRTLYVDGIVVVADIQDGLEDSDRGLYIGVGKDYAPGTFFSGLIDDVRIYNRAIRP